MITTDKIRYNIGEYLWNYWQNNHDMESIRNAEKTLRSEIEIGLRRRFQDFCEYQLLCNKLGIENKLNIEEQEIIIIKVIVHIIASYIIHRIFNKQKNTRL